MKYIPCSWSSPVTMDFLVARKRAVSISPNSCHHEFLPHFHFTAMEPANLGPKLCRKMVIMQAQGPEFQPLEPTYTARTAVHNCYPITQEAVPLASHAHTCPYMFMCTHMQTMELAHLAPKLLEPDSTKSFLF